MGSSHSEPSTAAATATAAAQKVVAAATHMNMPNMPNKTIGPIATPDTKLQNLYKKVHCTQAELCAQLDGGHENYLQNLYAKCDGTYLMDLYQKPCGTHGPQTGGHGNQPFGAGAHPGQEPTNLPLLMELYKKCTVTQTKNNQAANCPAQTESYTAPLVGPIVTPDTKTVMSGATYLSASAVVLGAIYMC